MRALIVDDEPLARRELRRLLAPFEWLQIVGEAVDVGDARKCIESLRPSLVFLDIQMPGGTGFDVLESIGWVPRVIFTTAYDHYAVKAFEVSALDYLLKPIEPQRLAAALGKVQTLVQASSTGQCEEVPALEQLFVRDGPRCWFVPLREVELVSAEGNYVRLHWGKARPLLNRSLIAVEQKLDPRRFFRANRQQIVNLDFIEAVETGTAGRLHIQLKSGQEIEVSRRQSRSFRMRTSV